MKSLLIRVAAFLPCASAPVLAGTDRVSLDTFGNEINGGCQRPDITANGRGVVFHSVVLASAISGDQDFANPSPDADVFFHDIPAGTTILISKDGTGNSPSGSSRNPTISRDGNRIAFESEAVLTPGDTNGVWDIYVYDLSTGTMSCVTAVGNAKSKNARISGDGSCVVFESEATNLVTGDTNGSIDVFLAPLDGLGVIIRVSVSSTEVQAASGSTEPHVSNDGSYIVFTYTDGGAANSLDAADTNGSPDVYLRDQIAGTTTRISGTPPNPAHQHYGHQPSVSDSGRFVAFDSLTRYDLANDPNTDHDIYVYDRQLDAYTLVSRTPSGTSAMGPGHGVPEIAGEGRYVAFFSNSPNILGPTIDTNNLADVFVFDMRSKTNVRVSVDSSGGQSTGGSCVNALLTPDGSFVIFESTKTNLVPNDTNGDADCFRQG